MDTENTLTLGRAPSAESYESRLQAVLRQAIGIGPVHPLTRPDIGGFVLLDLEIEIKSTQRLCLQRDRDAMILRTWPAELKTQAAALYKTGRADMLKHFLSLREPLWYAQPNLQLAFRSSPGAQRLFLKPRLRADEYIDRWIGPDFDCVGAHKRTEFDSKLWPWLRSRGYAGPEDDDKVEPFLKRLGRRDIFLRPGLEVTRPWPWAEAVELDERGALTGEVRSAVAELMTALNEPLPPGCIDP